MTRVDKLIYEMSSDNEPEKNFFVRKDWNPQTDQQMGNYQQNQSIIETTQLSNIGRYASYREATLQIPLCMTVSGATNDAVFQPATPATSADYAFGLKSSYLHLIHQLNIEVNGVSVVNPSQYINIPNHFKLITTMSYNDLLVQGPTLGFYPDTSTSFYYNASTTTTDGYIGTGNNQNKFAGVVVSGAYNSYEDFNNGFLQRQKYWNFDINASTSATASAQLYSALVSTTSLAQMYKSYIYNKTNGNGSTSASVFQACIMAIVQLRHLHDFFRQIPICKGLNLRLTLTLNQPVITFTMSATANIISSVQVQNSVGLTNPLMMASMTAGNGGSGVFGVSKTYVASLCVGLKPFNQAQALLTTIQTSPLQQGISLNVPSYILAPEFETTLIRAPTQRISYNDFQQFLYQGGIPSGSSIQAWTPINSLTNVQSVLLCPYYLATSNNGISPLLSPFDDCPSTTSPLCMLTNLQVALSGANIFTNAYKYTWETWLNQLQGVNGVNGGQTDGLSSGLISQLDFETKYCFHYANCARRLDIDTTVPHSVQISATNLSQLAIDLYCFVEYRRSIDLNILEGTMTVL